MALILCFNFNTNHINIGWAGAMFKLNVFFKLMNIWSWRCRFMFRFAKNIVGWGSCFKSKY